MEKELFFKCENYPSLRSKETYQSNKGVQRLFFTSIFPLYRLSSVVFSSWQSFFFTSSACSGYRYGSDSYRNQGQEKDDEAKGRGNSYTTEFRQYDSRVGRWLSIDNKIKEHPSESPYSAFRNSPILYVDQDGNEWINGHTVKVEELSQLALQNPDDTKISNMLEDAKKKDAYVATIIKTLQENDIALYNYIDNLQVEKKGQKVNVKVNVYAEDYNPTIKQSAWTKWTNNGPYVAYQDQENNSGQLAPFNKDKEIGFDVYINGLFSFADISLANEAGDVMFRIEYPNASYMSGTDEGKTDTEYRKPSTAGDYSERVEKLYAKRKKTNEGKDVNNNPYPISNVSEKNRR